MTAGDLQVVFGTGQIGAEVAAQLARSGVRVRAVSRHRPPRLAEGVEWCGADVTDHEAAARAAKGATVVYQCLNAPYTRWPQLFPPLQASVLDAAARASALLVTLENVYAYGSTGGAPLTEDLPAATTSVKGRVRVAMTRELLAAQEAGRAQVAIGRASDFFGVGVTTSSLGARVFANAVAARPVEVMGDPTLPHTYSYAPDVAAGLVTLGNDPRAIGQIWHLPGPQTVSTRAFVDLVADEVGHPLRIRSVPTALLRTLGLVSPLMRGLAEMAYQFEESFVLDTGKFEQTFGPAGTPLPDAIRETVAWYACRGRVS